MRGSFWFKSPSPNSIKATPSEKWYILPVGVFDSRTSSYLANRRKALSLTTSLCCNWRFIASLSSTRLSIRRLFCLNSVKSAPFWAGDPDILILSNTFIDGNFLKQVCYLIVYVVFFYSNAKYKKKVASVLIGKKRQP